MDYWLQTRWKNEWKLFILQIITKPFVSTTIFLSLKLLYNIVGLVIYCVLLTTNILNTNISKTCSYSRDLCPSLHSKWLSSGQQAIQWASYSISWCRNKLKCLPLHLNENMEFSFKQNPMTVFSLQRSRGFTRALERA